MTMLRRRLGPAAPWLAALLLSLLAFLLFRAGFAGGPSDDQRYLDAGRQWFAQGPALGTTHWALRHPLVLSIAAAFHLFGDGIAAAMRVPTLYAVLLAMVGFGILRRHAGPRAGWLWLALFLLNPIVHEMGSSLFPEIVELALAGTGLALVWSAAEASRPVAGRWVAAGVLFGLAVLTRETTALLAPLVGWIVWRAAGARGLALVAAGALAPVAADTLFLHALSGDWLYRLHVDSAHTHLASDHLRGGTFSGRPFFNTDLAARWVPAGPARVHWALNPLIDFVIDLRFGLLIVGWAVGALLFRSDAATDRPRHRAALVLALLAYIGVCWVLMLRPQPRYFLFVVLAASVSLALLIDAAWPGPRRRIATGLFAILCAAGLFGVARQHDNERVARLVLPYLRTHPGTYHTDPITADRVNGWLVEEGRAARLVATPPAPGDLVLRREKFAFPAGEERVRLATLDGKGEARWQSLRKSRPMIVERRLR